MKKATKYITALLSAAAFFGSCKKIENKDLNNPTIGAIVSNPAKGELDNLVTGTEAGLRLSLSFYLDDAGAIGREMRRYTQMCDL